MKIFALKSIGLYSKGKLSRNHILFILSIHKYDMVCVKIINDSPIFIFSLHSLL